MKIKELSQHGFPEAILKIWEKEESAELLPVQESAIAEGLLEGASLVIAAPTSSGKTFASEIAAYKCAEQQKCVIYLAPHKAIVEEKYRDFRDKYGQYGVRVVVSNGDHHEFDSDIRRNDFDLAVFTYEKLAMLLVASPEIASNCGLLIIDEMQMLSDHHRGPGLELLLTKFLTVTAGPQVLALSATIDRLNGLDKWLRAKPLLIRHRPIDLREGVYAPDGSFRFVEWNSKRTGTETFPKSPSDKADAMLDTVVAHLIAREEQVLVFRRQKDLTVSTAERIGALLDLPAATQAIADLQLLENTGAREKLVECLRNGVAFHNADLVFEERQAIERHFREERIRVVCSTSTLAMGVNLPSKTVIVADTDEWTTDERTGQFSLAPLPVGKYRNMSGRAGRLQFHDDFGRSILLGRNQFQCDKYRLNYIGGTVASIESSLGNRPITQQVLDIVVSKLGEDESEVVGFMMSTFAGFRKWTTDETRKGIRKMIQESIEECYDLELVGRTAAGKLAATDLGKACASKKISTKTFVLLRQWLSGPSPVNEFATLYYCSQAGELYRIKMSTQEFDSNGYVKYIRQNHDALAIPTPILEELGQSTQRELGYDRTKQLKSTLLAGEWIDGRQYRELERAFRLAAGPIRNMSQGLAWIVDSAAEFAPLLGRSHPDADMLSTVAERLRYGVPEDMLAVARLRVPGVNRTQMMRLRAQGYNSLDAIVDADLADFQGVISQTVAARLQEHIQRSMNDSLGRQRRGHVLRLQSLGVDTALLEALYEHMGTQLEITLCDLFRPPFCSLLYERIPKQREGEPDALLHLPSGRVVAFSVSAREKHNISMKKAQEIIGSAARFKPIARVVLGRPDFHELAIKNAAALVADGTNYKLVPMPVLAEMYVRVHEGRLAEDSVLRILKEHQGYLTCEALDHYT